MIYKEDWKEKEKRIRQKTSKMADINLAVSIIIWNIQGLSILIKR